MNVDINLYKLCGYINCNDTNLSMKVSRYDYCLRECSIDEL